MPVTETTPPKKEVPDPETCWELLERVVSSTPLRRTARLRDLLLYVGRCSLKEHRDKIHENEIGSAVFERPAEYDTSVDPIVRVNATELRKRIEAYFNSEGLNETLIMEIPRGGYTPVFWYRSVAPDSTRETSGEIQAAVLDPVLAVSPVPENDLHRRWISAALAVAGALILALAIGCIFFWSQYRSLHRSVYAWQYKPTVAALWSQFLNTNPNTDVVISDAGIGMVEALSKKTFSLNEYLSHSYVSQIQVENLSPDMHTALNRILSWDLASPDEFTLARRILALDPLGRNIQLYNARNYMPDQIKRDNVILIGARKSNPWAEIFDSRMNFITDFGSPRVINRAPAPGEQAVYTQTNSDGYSIVAYLPNIEHSGVVLLIEGTNAEATEAAGDFLLSEDQLSSFKRMLHVNQLPYFQVLLKVSAVRGTPLAVTVEAYRISPNLP